MTSTAVLAQTDSVANWVAAVGQVLGAVGTFAAVVVALRLARWERRRDTAERRDREAAQARLVTITVDYRDFNRAIPGVVITNHSEQPVHRPEVHSMGDPRPPVRWGPRMELKGYPHRPTEVLSPHGSRYENFHHIDGAGVFTRDVVQRVRADDVTITFVDAAGLRWRRTGNGEPVRVVHPPPGTE